MLGFRPGTVDLQLNGYAGIDLNSNSCSIEQIRHLCAALARDGNAAVLATLITADLADMEHRARQIVAAREADATVAEMIAGIHFEGPFLNPAAGYIGAHPSRHARPTSLSDLNRLLDAAAGLTRIVTLAPEVDPGFQAIRYLVGRGVHVAAGHCNPSWMELRHAIDNGLSMFTHLGNGCPLLLHRHDNIVQRVLACADRLHIGFIADGIHVPFFALGNYLQLVGNDRVFIVTDAVAAAGQGPGQYQLAGQTVVVDDDLATWSNDRSHLIGSAMTMPRVRDNLRQALNCTEAQIEQWTRINPAQFLAPSP